MFSYFVVFAEMRTGSNFLEANLNALNGVTCLGEAFNAVFIGYPERSELLNVTQSQRDADPLRLIERIKQAEGLNGFRYFNDHDPRVLDAILSDPNCAKIVLTRNPLDAYVSLKIAKATGQWKLTDVKRRKETMIRFDADEFEDRVATLQAFQVSILRALQVSGQTAFYVDYDDLRDVDVMNGLAAFLGVPDRLSSLDTSLKKQNPAPPSQKVANYDEMERALARVDRFNLTRTPNFEPRRGAAIPNYVAAAESSLLYMPIAAGPNAAVTEWLAGLDEVDLSQLRRDFSQKTLRQWKEQRAGHRTFAVVRHPVTRAHAAFCHRILSTGEGAYLKIRDTLRRRFGLKLPDTYPDPDYGRMEHRAAFLGYLEFVKSNLAGQTGIRVDGHWATQSQILSGFAGFAVPDAVLRENHLEDELAVLASQVGKETMPRIVKPTDPYASLLDEIYDADIEAATQRAYGRDYTMFGFGTYA